MVGYTQFSRDETSTDRKKLWDPSTTLGIINADRGCITCVGYAPTQRRRCRNPIRQDNRELITEALNDIAYMNPDSPAVLSRLRAIAGPALCVRYHQNQAETVVTQWQRKLQQLKPQIGERKPTKPVQSSRKQESVQEQSMKDLLKQLREGRELLAELQKEMNSQRQRGLEKERVEKDRVEKERLEKERLQKERLEKERLEKERLEKEKREREEKKQREREQAASNERIRQRAQKSREQRQREKREKEQKERDEWDQSWTKYQEGWVHFRTSTAPREGNLRDVIPWPVKSGSHRDVTRSNVEEFLQKAVPSDANVAKVMRKECQKWHPDMIHRLLRGAQLTDVDQMMVDMICRVVTDLLNKSARRSAEFLG
jgi:hypothetical protein